MQKEMTSKRMVVTPKMAAEFLKLNVCNRKFKQHIANHYAMLMNRGEWSQTSTQGIDISVSGLLMNGQHRLSAIVKSGVSVNMFVHENVPDENFKTMDTGAKRSMTDIIDIAGVENPKSVSAIITKFLILKNNSGRSGTYNKGKTGLSANDILDEYSKRPDFWQTIVENTNKFHKAFGTFLEPSHIGAWYATCMDIDQSDADHYFKMLSTGIGFTSDKDPIAQYRSYLIKNREEKNTKTVTVPHRFALFAKSWNNFRDKKIVSFLRYSAGETFPVLK